MLEITEFPKFFVEEGTRELFKCASGEGNPPPIIRWNHGTGTNKIKSGKFNASVTESTLDIKVDRTMHEQEIACFIASNSTYGQKRLEQKVCMSVKCKLFLTFIYF